MGKSKKRIENSYKSYLSYRQSYKERGYGLRRLLTFEEYTEAHVGLSHAHFKHIARTVAFSETTATRKEGASIVRRIKQTIKEKKLTGELDENLEELGKKYKKAKDILAVELTPKEVQEIEMNIRQGIIERTGEEPRYPIQANTRTKIFNELLDAGLSYREANKVLYG